MKNIRKALKRNFYWHRLLRGGWTLGPRDGYGHGWTWEFSTQSGLRDGLEFVHLDAGMSGLEFRLFGFSVLGVYRLRYFTVLGLTIYYD